MNNDAGLALLVVGAMVIAAIVGFFIGRETGGGGSVEWLTNNNNNGSLAAIRMSDVQAIRLHEDTVEAFFGNQRSISVSFTNHERAEAGYRTWASALGVQQP